MPHTHYDPHAHMTTVVDVCLATSEGGGALSSVEKRDRR